MYLRNAKQILRAASFDERRYGFGGLIDLFRACSREGLVRMERDRRGGLRLFQGPALTQGIAARPPTVEAAARAEIVEFPGGDSLPNEEETPQEIIELQPAAVVDTTAELLGRAKPRKPRTRAASSLAAARPPRSSEPKKAGTRKTARRSRSAKKSEADEAEG
jgi:hypothetical protein